MVYGPKEESGSAELRESCQKARVRKRMWAVLAKLKEGLLVGFVLGYRRPKNLDGLNAKNQHTQ